MKINRISKIRQYGIALAFLLAGTTFLGAQEPLVTWGEPINSPNSPVMRVSDIFKNEEPGFYAFRKTENASREGYFLEKYDDSFKRLFSKEVPYSEGVMGNMLLFQKLLPLKEKMVVFYSGFKKDAKESFLVVRDVLPDGSIDKKEVKLESIPAEKAINPGTFYMIASPDYSKLLVITTHPYVKDQKAKVSLKAFDAGNMKQLWSKEATFDFDSKKGNVAHYLIDNKGNAYVMMKYTKDSNKPAYDMCTYSIESSAWKTINLDIEAKWFGDQNDLIFDSNGDVVFVSFLNEKVARKYNSILYVRFNGKTQGVEVNKQISLEAAGNDGKSEELLLNWKIKDVVSQSNGTVLIIGEDEKMTRTSDAQQGLGNYTYTYRNGDITVFAILPDGNKAWVRSLFKAQESTVNSLYERWDSFVYALVNDRLVIIYNNTDLFNIWNSLYVGVKPYKKEEFALKTRRPAFLYVIEPNGSTVYEKKYGLPLFDFQKGILYSMDLNAYTFLPLQDGILIMDESTQSQKYQFGKVIL